VQKLDAAGNFIWAKSMGGNGPEEPVSICVDGAGNIFNSGAFYSASQCDWDPGPGTYIMNCNSSWPTIYINVINSAGNFLWARQLSAATTTSQVYFGDACVDPSDNYLASGSFWSGMGQVYTNMDFDPGPGTYTLATGTQINFFNLKWYVCNSLSSPGAISGSVSVCSGNNITYSVPLLGGATSYSWSLPGGWTGTSTTNIISVTTGPASGTISVAGVNGCGAGTPTTLAVTSVSAPATPGLISGSVNVCQTTLQNYSIAIVGGAASYSWVLPGGWSGTSTTNIITTTVGPSSGNILVYAINACGVSSAQSLSVTVNPTPPMPGAISGNILICSGSTNIYSIALVGGATSYSWTKPGGWTGTSSTNTISTTASSTSGNILVTANNACGSSPAQTLSVTVNTAPTTPGIISGSAAICSGSSNSYSIAIVGGASSYSWTLPAGWSGNSSTNIINTTANSNSGLISVIATNSCGNSSAQTLSVTVNIPPATPGTISGSTSLCAGASANYSVTLVAGATSYNWSLPAGWSGSSLTNTINATSGSTGVFTITASNACGTSGTRTLNVTVNPSPTVSISGGGSPICVGSIVTLTANGAASYLWSTGAITSTIAPSPTISTTYTVTGTSLGCSNSVAQTITVNPLPNVTANASNTLICNGNTVSLSGGGANTYTWTGGVIDGVAFSPIATSNYTVTGTSLAGCNNTAAVTVSVNNIPANPSAISGPTAACIGAPSTIYSINPVVGASTYVWSLPAGWSGSSTTNSISATPGISGGVVSVFASNTCGSSATETLNVIVNPSPIVSANGTPMSVCPASNVTLSASGANSYSWSSGALTVSTVVNPLATSIYTVTGTDGNGCSNFTTITIGVFNSPTVSAASSTNILCLGQSATLTANGALTYSWSTGSTIANIVISPSTTTSYTLTGIDGNSCGGTFVFTQSVTVCAGLFSEALAKEETFILYPNPTNGILNVETSSGDENLHFQLFNVIGELLMDEPITTQKSTYNIQYFSNGIYFVRVGSITNKIIKL
jgi:hypothetical protein